MEYNFVSSDAVRDRNAVIEILREKDHHYKNILETLPAAVYTCDAKGYITFFNKAAAALWGREPQIGRDLWCGSWKIYNVDGERMMPDSCPMAIALKEGKALTGTEIIIERQDGVRRNVLPHPQPLFDAAGNVSGAMNMLIDITEQKQTQYTLSLTEKRKKDLSESNHSLLQINRELEQFAYITSHDLQEPVRKIHVYTERLQEKNRKIFDAESRHFMERIISAAKRMNLLISEVLNFSRSANEPNKFVKTDLNEIFRTVLEDLELRIEQTKARIHCDVLPVAEVIPLQVSQLLYNIIANSIKFGAEDKPVFIEVAARMLPANESADLNLQGGKRYFEIIVKDNGIGFSNKSAEDIFTVFHRLKGTKPVEGSGIGLAICRKIVTLHQGIIFAESCPGEGTMIHVVLPFRQ